MKNLLEGDVMSTCSLSPHPSVLIAQAQLMLRQAATMINDSQLKSEADFIAHQLEPLIRRSSEIDRAEQH